MNGKRIAFQHALVSLRLVAGIASFALAAASACSSGSSSPGAPGEDASTDATGNPIDARAVDAAAVDAATADGRGADTGTTEGSTVEASAPVDGGGSPGDGGVDALTDGAAGIVVTSPAFAEGQPIPTANTCAGADTSPEIDWTAGPAATLSYALVVSDLTASANIHWVIWDLPPTTRKLPAMLPNDPVLTSPVSANQVDLRTSPDAATPMNGFFGPCPRGATHSYEFALHAMDVAVLPGVTTTTPSPTVKAAVLMHSLAEGILTGTSNAAPPADGGSPSDAAGQ